MTFQQFKHKEAYHEQVIEAKRLSFEITDKSGEILSQNALVKILKENEIEYKPNKMTIVHGKSAFLVGLILNYLGERTISVDLLARKKRERLRNTTKLNLVRWKNSHQRYALDVSSFRVGFLSYLIEASSSYFPAEILKFLKYLPIY